MDARKLRENINRNVERANKQWAREHQRTEAPKEIREYHRKMFEGAEYKRDREHNRKRGVK